MPPRETQIEIAEVLDRETAQIDKLIGKQNALIELLGERRQAVVTRAVTKGLDPRASLEPSGYPLVPEIPAGWRVEQLGRLAAIGNGSTPNRDRVDYWEDGTIPWLNSSNVNRDVVTDANQFVTDVARAESHLPMVPEGSLLVGLTGEGKTRGMVTILGIRATINQHVAFVTPRSGVLQTRYLMWSFIHFYEALRELSNENGSTKGGLTCQALKQFRVPLPPVDVQRQIAVYLDSVTAGIDLLVEKAQKFIALATERRSALITAAVTGKIDVRGRV